jgi:hypothetical protein
MTIIGRSTIRDLSPKTEAAPQKPRKVFGASLGTRGGALVGALHDAESVTVTDFYTYPPRLAALGQELRQLPQDSIVFVDAGLHGRDLWAFLGRKAQSAHWRLFEVERPEQRRAELVGRLRAAHEREEFRILRGFGDEDRLRKVLSEATREDAHERVEVAALSLAVVNRRRVPRIW